MASYTCSLNGNQMVSYTCSLKQTCLTCFNVSVSAVTHAFFLGKALVRAAS